MLRTVAVRKEVERARILAAGFETLAHRSVQSTQPAEIKKEWDLFRYAGVDGAGIRRTVIRIGTASILAVLGALLLRSVYPLLLPALWVAGEYLRLGSRAFGRAQSFERDFTALLVSLASSVRAGVDPLEAMAGASELFVGEGEMKRELLKFREELEKGASSEEALSHFGGSIHHPDIELFTTALILNLTEGASLAGSLERLTKVIRQRQSFRRKMRSAVAMQRLSAIGIAGAFLAILGVQAAANYEVMEQVFADPMGRSVLGCGVALLMIGAAWMVQLCRSRM